MLPQREKNGRRLSRAASAIGLFGGAILVAGCLGKVAGSPGANGGDLDAGTGYEVDLAGEDLTSGPVPPGRYHPVGYLAVEIHGRDFNLQVQDCRSCHGQDLAGAPSAGFATAPPSCDGCHPSTWRTDCTFCHGSTGGTGAPPVDLNGESDPSKISFPGHAAHQSGRIAPVFDCVQCHLEPTDLLTPGHAFDGTPRRGENVLNGGLSPAGVYDPVALRCNTTYCHGSGRGADGSIAKNAPGPLPCSGCHPDITTTARWTQMSGEHRRHLGLNNVSCTHCHGATVAVEPSTISDKTKHLDGQRQVQFGLDATGITWDAANRRCTGTCHNDNHQAQRW